MTLPIAPVVLPSDLVGHPNGRLPSELLTDVGPSGMLHHTAARAWRALVAGASEVGLPLTYTYGGTYRTLTQQTVLFESRYSPTGTGGGCKFYKGQQWCKKSPNLATAAVPGTSNHGIGLAIDTAYDDEVGDGIGPDDAAGITGHPQWPWFRVNAERFGFSWELQSEPWHIRYVTGDVIPQAVLDYEASIAPPLEPTPEPLPPVDPSDPLPTEIAPMLFIAKPTFPGATASDPWLVYYSEPGSSPRVERATNAHVRAATILKVPVVDQDSQEQYLDTRKRYGI